VVAVGVLVVLALLTARGVGASSRPPQDADAGAADTGAAAAGDAAEGNGLRNPDGTVGPVVALGDSITSGMVDRDTGAVASASWYAAALADEPRLESAANAGYPGNTTLDMADRFVRDVAAHEPRVVVIMGGTNDLRAGRTTDEVLATLEELAARTRDLGATPVLATIPPRTDGDYAGQVAELNAGLRRLGEQTGTTVIDFHSVVADDDGRWRPGFSSDGIHPTRAAGDAMARLAVTTLLGD
jgi:lysophospholipase L1-like esterase